ncbi:MAG: dihydrodipicolinate synthase family protein, partial [Acidobacteria bacterium ACB2]|nr:dihydrodipicolinate synthase family protein [Acidobacteria bacterium ACB2]
MRILPVARLVTSRFGVSGLKAALALLGHPAGLPRLPLLPLPEEHRPEVGSTLREAGLLPA